MFPIPWPAGLQRTRGLVYTFEQKGALARPHVLPAPDPLYNQAPRPTCTGGQAPPGLLAEWIHSGNGPQFVSGILSRTGYSVQMALWWVTRQSAFLSYSCPCHRMVNYWAIPHLVEPQHQAPIQALTLKGWGRGGVLPPGDPPFLWPSGGSSMRSPTTAAACTWWREATSAASPTGRPTVHACSRSAGCSTSSSRKCDPGKQ